MKKQYQYDTRFRGNITYSLPVEECTAEHRRVQGQLIDLVDIVIMYTNLEVNAKKIILKSVYITIRIYILIF